MNILFIPSSTSITDNFIKMDLSKKSCLKKLEKLPKPDVVCHFVKPNINNKFEDYNN